MGQRNMAESGGLAGTEVAEISTCLIDGEQGRLSYAGYDIETLAEQAQFEEVCCLLLNGELPNAAQLEALRQEIAQSAVLPAEIRSLLAALPQDADPMAVLRTAVSAYGLYDEDAELPLDREAMRRVVIRLCGQVAAITAAWARIRNGQAVVAARADLTLAANFVAILFDREPDATTTSAINSYLVLLAEHGLNASTFAARVITATGSDVVSAVVGGIGTLKGPAHGGANSEAMRMFQEIGAVENVDSWFEREVKQGGRRIMGIGHRVYKAPDPRAAILQRHADALSRQLGERRWYEIATALAEKAAADEYFIQRRLFPNVDYYSAVLLASLGLASDLFTPLFAVARTIGWGVHAIAQRGGRLIRPKGRYVGPAPRPFIPLAER